MIERKVVLKNRTGLHARPASELVAFAKELPCKVYLEHNGKKAAADSILQLLALGAKEGSELVLSADGEGDKHSVEKLVYCWRKGVCFHEPTNRKTGSLSGDSGGISLEG